MSTNPHDVLIERVAVPAAGYTLPMQLPPEPFGVFASWFNEERAARRTPNPDAMTLATVDRSGMPSARIVLCRRVDPAAGTLMFFTNYTSPKSEDLAATGVCAACFHWDQSERQARITGRAVKAGEAESDAYFAQRPWESKLSAWASDQSRPIAGRTELLAKLTGAAARLGLDAAELLARGQSLHIPRPPHWGGWTITATRVELWIGGKGRLHDRAAWVRELGPEAPGPWSASRLQP
ncbi:MAG TPA: pyridoxamine 5'-phosphate oxidase [Phycisphaerales bacterium]|nr:pyridoxamine 5'-phosphate oxidase [Phycisphaerales bacterium]